MSKRQFCRLSLAFALLGPLETAFAQESPPAASAESGTEKSYHELGRSKDKVIRGYAERYLDLVKVQEWASAGGSKITAKYVSHDPDLKRVTLGAVKGTGSARTTKEISVEVGKLSKACQSRVRQIDALQKKLQELEAKAKEEGETSGQPAAAESPEAGAPMVDERGAEPSSPEGVGPESPAPSTPAAGTGAGQSEADSGPDPLGFSEISLAPVPEGAPTVGPQSSISTSFLGTGTPGGAVDRTQWRTSYPAFVFNIRVETDAGGGPQINWGEMRELHELNEAVKAKYNPEAPQPPEPVNPAEIAARVGDVQWRLAFDRIAPSEGGPVEVQFQGPQVPQPLELKFVLDETENAQNWSALPPSSPVVIKGRLAIDEPNKIKVIVQMAPPGASDGPEAPPAGEPAQPETERR